MSDHTITAIVSVLLAITGLAIIAVLVSPQAKTGGVLTSASGSLSQALCTALSPVTGSGNCGGLLESVSSIFKPL